MQADTTTTSVQSGRPALSQQAGLLNWRKLSSDFLFYAGMQIAMYTLICWKSYPHFRSHDFTSHEYIKCVLGAVAISLGMVGYGTLNRIGSRRVLRILLVCRIILTVLLCISIVQEGPANSWFYAVLTLLATPLPLSLYLNRNQSRSTSQPATNNAS
jgi:hypothetical protein